MLTCTTATLNPRRSDRSCVLLPIWDQHLQQLVLPPFDTTITSWQALSYQRLLCMPDEKLLECMSTSPVHEPTWFVQGGLLWGGGGAVVVQQVGCRRPAFGVRLARLQEGARLPGVCILPIGDTLPLI